MRTIKKIIIGAAFAAFLLGTVQTYVRTSESLQNDYSVYYKTAERLKAGSTDKLYNPEDGAYPYRYTPPTLTLAFPLSYFSEPTARKLFLIIQALSVFAAFFIIYKILSPFTVEALTVTSATFLLTFRFYLDLLICGQISGSLLLLMALATHSFIKKRFTLSAIFVSCASLLKLLPAFLFVLFVKSKQKLKLVVCVVGFISGLHILLSFFVPPALIPGLYSNWVHIVSTDTQYFDGSTSRNQALKGLLQRLEGRELIGSTFVESAWFFMLAATLLGFLFVILKTNTENRRNSFSLWGIGALMLVIFMPQALPHSFVLLALPISILLSNADRISVRLAVLSYILFCAIPGSDVTGHAVTEWINCNSFPLLSLIFLLLALFSITCRGKSKSDDHYHITADDWGLSEGVNEGILELAKRGVVKRVSLMANEPYLEYKLDELRKIQDIKLGLHFNLTHGRLLDKQLGLGTPANLIKEWTKSVLTGRKEMRQRITDEFSRQLERVEKLGISLSYCDSHHHVLIVPGLLGLVSQKLKNSKIDTVRVPFDPRLLVTSKFPVAVLAAISFFSIRKNFSTLLFCYPQYKHFDSADKFLKYIKMYKGAEVTIHPAARNDIETLEFTDSFTNQRVREFNLLVKLSGQIQ